MRKILNIFEQDENEVELNDFQKILALNKRKISPSEVEFTNSEGDSYDDFITVEQDGLMFTFDGLQQYLSFFFPDTYGEDNTDGEYEAGYYESMYRGNWTWDFDDRSYDDWREGIIVEALKPSHLEIIYDAAKIIQPGLLSAFVRIEGTNKLKIKDVDRVTTFLDQVDRRISDDLTNSWVNASVAAVDGEVGKYIEDTYCDCLNPVGIERYSEKFCFWKYKLHWGDAIMLYPRFGTEDDNLLDLLFLAISKEHISHLPEYYEIQYNIWNNEEFDASFDHNADNDLENFKDRVLEESNDETLKKYYMVIDKINSTIGFDKYVNVPNSDVRIMIKGVNKETLKVKFLLLNRNEYSHKYGESYIDDILNMVYNESLFNPMEYRKD